MERIHMYDATKRPDIETGLRLDSWEYGYIRGYFERKPWHFAHSHTNNVPFSENGVYWRDGYRCGSNRANADRAGK